MKVNSAKLIALGVVVCGLLSVACPPNKSGDSDVRSVGPDVRADMLIYFKADITDAQIASFSKEVLSRADPNNQGDYPALGVRTVLRLPRVEGHHGIAVTFFPDSPKKQREDLRRAVASSSVVDKVLDNSVPMDVKKIH